MVKINRLEIENVKRIRAVTVEPAENGLTVIGGRNGQGKTSVLDAIAWALGGDRYKPSQAMREGSVIPPTLSLRLSNGLIVERKGKNSDLKVTDPDGRKSGQQLLNEFVNQLALDLPRFMAAPSREKAQTLLKIIGVEDQLISLERQEQDAYNRRHAIGQIADQKRKYAKEQPFFTDAPKEPVSASELIRQQQDILARNGENQRKRENLRKIEEAEARMRRELEDLKARYDVVLADLEIARKSALDLHDESTEELERNLARIDEINRKVRANLDRDKAEEDALAYENQYNALTAEIGTVRQKKIDLLRNAALPLPGLSVEDGELTYNGFKWDNLSGSAQLKVATAIVRALNPKCGFVLLDGLEALDLKTLKEFGEWLESESLQAIATRVSAGAECSIIIEDGYVVGQENPTEPDSSVPKWKAGEF